MTRHSRLVGGALPSLLLLLLMAPAAALGHTELVASDPSDGAVLVESPGAVVLTFSGELSPDGSGFEVIGPDGEVAGSGSLDLDVADRNVLRGTMASSASGSFTINWTSAAIDGHEAAGELTFAVEAAVDPTPDTALASPASAPALIVGLLLVAAAAALTGRRLRRHLGLVAISASVAALAGCVPGAAACPSSAPTIDVTVTATSMSPNDPSACRGQELTLRVAAESDGVFHIHGYDESVPATAVTAGETTEISFTAERAGQFPIEFHANDDPAGVEIGILTVNEP